MRMMIRVMSFSTVLILLITLTNTQAAEQSPVWKSDFQAAQAEAQKRGVPMVLHFYADWCGPCQRMEREVLNSLSVKRQLNQSLIGVKVNSDKHPLLAQQFKINSLPTDVFLSPGGHEIGRNSGFVTAMSYTSKLSRLQANYKRDESVKVAKATEEHKMLEKSWQQEHVSIHSVRKPIERSAHNVLIGLHGYSPVSLQTERAWRRGSEKFAVNFRGITYLLASESEKSSFEATPERYAPKLLGCDPVILQQDDRAVPGNIRYGAFYEGELYLFQNRENLKTFKTQPVKYIHIRHALNVDALEPVVLR